MRSSWLARFDGLFLLIVAGVSCLFGACVAIATTHGAALSHDSVAYIGAARSLLDGRGLVIPFGAALPVPLTHWPPLYPLVLAMAGLIIPEIEGAARWLSIGLFVLNTILIASLARKFTNCIFFGYAGAFVFASSLTMWRLHAMVMAEPLFIFLVLVCTYFLDEYLTIGGRLPLLVAALGAGLSIVTRYAGLPFLVWGATIILYNQRSSLRRWNDAVMWTLAAGAPMMLLTAWNLRVAGTGVPRTVTWHPQNLVFFGRMLTGVADFILPDFLPHRIWVIAGVCLIVAPIVGTHLIRRPVSRESYLVFLIALNVTLVQNRFVQSEIRGIPSYN